MQLLETAPEQDPKEPRKPQSRLHKRKHTPNKLDEIDTKLLEIISNPQ